MSDQRKARANAFNIFMDRNGRPTFSPEFHDSMVNVLRASPKVACLTERVWAWQKWRSWCNSNEYAISDWVPGRGRPLDQTDCALDIWWFKQRKSAEFVIGAPRELRDKERQRKEVQHFKTAVGRAFKVIEARGDLRVDGGKLYSVMSPSADKAPSAVAGSSYRTNKKAFHKWRAVARSSNHQTYLETRSAWNHARKVERSDYRAWLDATTAETAETTTACVKVDAPAANVAAVEALTLVTLSNRAFASVSESSSSSSITAPPAEPKMMVMDPRLSEQAQIAEAVAIHSNAGNDWVVQHLIDEPRAQTPDATADEIVQQIHANWDVASKKGNPLGYLVKSVANAFSSPVVVASRRARAREAIERDELAEAREQERQKALEREHAAAQEAELRADQRIAAMGSPAWQDLVRAKIREIKKDWPNRPDDILRAIAEQAVRRELGQQAKGAP